MDLALTPEQGARRASVTALLAKHASPEQVRAAEPIGHDDALWRALGRQGWVDLPDLLDLALVAEELGRHLAPVPFAEVAAARRRYAGRPGAAITTLAVRPPIDGWARLVPAGAVADAVIALIGDDLVAVDVTDDRRGRAVTNLGSMPLADCRVDGDAERGGGVVVVLARGADASRAFQGAVDEWRVLTAAALVGLATGALDLAVGHVSRREQFGVPVGSFQAVQHRLADVATDLDGARLLVRKAAWAAQGGEPEAAVLAAMAFVWAAGTAHRVATESLHFHGGYGYTLDHDIQLFFRRATAWPLVLGDPDRELGRLGDLLYAGRR